MRCQAWPLGRTTAIVVANFGGSVQRLTALATATLAYSCGVAAATPPTPVPVGLAQVTSSSCSRVGIATAAMGFLLSAERTTLRRHAAPMASQETAADTGLLLCRIDFQVAPRPVRAEEGSAVPGATRRWTADGFSFAEMILVDARPNLKQPANSGIVLAWIRYPTSGEESVLLGRGKGVWDCEKRRLAMWVGSEQSAADEAEARQVAGGQCRRRPNNTTIRRYSQRALLCGRPRS